MPKITPFLWFDNQAEEAVKFYTSIIKKFESWKNSALQRRRSVEERQTSRLGLDH